MGRTFLTYATAPQPWPLSPLGKGEIEVWRVGWLCHPTLQNPQTPFPHFAGRGQRERRRECKICPPLNPAGRGLGDGSQCPSKKPWLELLNRQLEPEGRAFPCLTLYPDVTVMRGDPLLGNGQA